MWMRRESREDVSGRNINPYKGPEALSPVAYFREPQTEVFPFEETCRSASNSQPCLSYGLVNCMGSLLWTLEVRDRGMEERESHKRQLEAHMCNEVNSCLVIVEWQLRM